MCCRWLRIAHLIGRGLIHMGFNGPVRTNNWTPTDTGHVQHRHLTTNFKTAGNAADIGIAAQVSKSFTTAASNEPLVAGVGSARPSHDGNEKSVTYCRSERLRRMCGAGLCARKGGELEVSFSMSDGPG